MRLLAIVSRRDEFPLPDVQMGAFGFNWGNWTVSRTFHRMVAPEGAFFQTPQRIDDGTGFPGGATCRSAVSSSQVRAN